MAIPHGFSRHDRSSPLTAPWEPIYARHTCDAVILGIQAAEPHTNARGFVHGGLISALADNAMGLSCAKQLTDVGGLLTVSLSVDFLGVARIGQWLAFETRFTRLGGTICFAQAFVTADDTICARSNATFASRPPEKAPNRPRLTKKSPGVSAGA